MQWLCLCRSAALNLTCLKAGTGRAVLLTQIKQENRPLA